MRGFFYIHMAGNDMLAGVPDAIITFKRPLILRVEDVLAASGRGFVTG